jgi:DNA-binding HxlR family transcriptional regulator
VARDGTLLAGSVDAHVELDQLGWPADESGSELPVERRRHLLVESPRQDWQTGSVSESQCRLGGPLMVRVTGNASFVEDQQEVGTNSVGDLADLGRKHVEPLVGKAKVRVLEQLDMTDTELKRRVPELAAADLTQRFQVLSERRGLAAREAQDRREDASICKLTERTAEAEALVVRMSTDDEDGRR